MSKKEKEIKAARGTRVVFEDDVACAWCGKRNHILSEKETVKPAEKGEYKIHTTASKSVQKRIDED